VIVNEGLRAGKHLLLELVPMPGPADAFGDEAAIVRDGNLLGGAEG
jgi:hypothetical protein